MGEIKNGIGNRGLKEPIYTTHGHELRWRECWRFGGTGWRRNKRGNIGKTVIA